MRHADLGPDGVPVDISPMRVLRATVAARPAAISLRYGEHIITAKDFEVQARRIAAGLRRLGVSKGDRVALLAHNCPLSLVLFFACASVGAVFMPLNYRLSVSELQEIADHAQPTVFVAEADFAAQIGVYATLHSDRRWILIDTDPAVPCSDGSLPPVWTRLSSFIGVDPVEPLALTFNDQALLVYTSGSTGKPRGVVVTHGNLWWGWRNMDEISDTRLRDVHLAVAPLGHLAGLNGLALRALVRGGTVIVMRQFDPAEALRTITDYRVTTMFAVPTMVDAMMALPDYSDSCLSSLNCLLLGATTVPAQLLRDLAARGINVMHAWGSTETTGVCLYLPSELAFGRPDAVGVPVPYTDVRLADPSSGEEITTPGVTGELVVRGPGITPGYWRDPEATNRDIRDGWLHTGDLAYRDASGLFSMAGRCKDVIISGGENIYPTEVEAALRTIPAVRDVVVVGVPDVQWGETPSRSWSAMAPQHPARTTFATWSATGSHTTSFRDGSPWWTSSHSVRRERSTDERCVRRREISFSRIPTESRC